MPKRRRLSNNQKVIIIYEVGLGYVNKPAIFQRYSSIQYNNVKHDIPVFICKEKEITGEKCFWVLPSDVKSNKEIEQMQRNLIPAQLKVFEIGKKENYIVPDKLQDPQIKEAAEQKTKRLKAIIEKFGFDPRDESWVEDLLTEAGPERNWFEFERTTVNTYSGDPWEEIMKVFNKSYTTPLDIDQSSTSFQKKNEISFRRCKYANVR